MSFRSLIIIAVACGLAVAGCREPDRPLGPGSAGTVFVNSDPQGARIVVNGRETGRVTPDTLRDLRAGRDTLSVRLDTAGLAYGFSVPVGSAPSDGSVVEIDGALLLRCFTAPCFADVTRYFTPNRARFAAGAMGTLFLVDGGSGGLYWPGTTSNSYVAGAAAVIAGVVASTGDTVALGPYNRDYLAGRPVQTERSDGGAFRLRQPAWVLPPRTLRELSTMRGIEIEQEIIASDAVDDVVLLRLVFRNVTGRTSYRNMDSGVPAGGLTYESAYIGFAVDADVGLSDVESADDLASYVPDEQLAFIYDGDFHSPDFDGGWTQRPGLIGVRVVDSPDDTEVVLNAWPREGPDGAGVDWRAGQPGESSGLGWMSGRQAGFDSHPDPRVGYVPSERSDYRILAAAGPLRLAPGDSAAVTVAVALAAPADGTFSSGTTLSPGDPSDDGRSLLETAAPLIERARAADGLLTLP